MIMLLSRRRYYFFDKVYEYEKTEETKTLYSRTNTQD